MLSKGPFRLGRIRPRRLGPNPRNFFWGLKFAIGELAKFRHRGSFQERDQGRVKNVQTMADFDREADGRYFCYMCQNKNVLTIKTSSNSSLLRMLECKLIRVRLDQELTRISVCLPVSYL